MQYRETILLKDGRECVLRSGEARDGAEVLAVFNKTHAQTDFLTTYPEENTFTVEQETAFLQAKAESANEVEVVAEIDGRIVGTAGIESVGGKEKIRHRATFGIGIDRAYWGLGLGRAMTEACVACAKKAGYAQLELDVVAANERAVALYRSVGFTEYGRNPRGFRSRLTGWQPLLLMRLELDG